MDNFGSQLVNEHREIVKAIRAGKPELARQKAADHVYQTIHRTMSLNFGTLNAGIASRCGRCGDFHQQRHARTGSPVVMSPGPFRSGAPNVFLRGFFSHARSHR